MLVALYICIFSFASQELHRFAGSNHCAKHSDHDYLEQFARTTPSHMMFHTRYFTLSCGGSLPCSDKAGVEYHMTGFSLAAWITF